MARKRRSNYKKNSQNDKVDDKKDLSTNPSSKESSSEKEVSTGKDDPANHPRTSINDPEWYKKFPALSFGAGNLPFSEQLGSALDIHVEHLISPWGERYLRLGDKPIIRKSIPGIASLKVKPTYGLNTDYNDPLNVAANQYYANVRYVNSGRKNYDSVDLMIATLAIADLYSFVMWCQRIYGYAYMFSIQNKYINKALISANGVDPKISTQLANFRYWLNSFIARVSAFAVPGDINIFRRRAYMYAHLYTESTTGNIKDQLYQFIPDGFYQYGLDTTHKGCLKYTTLSSFSQGKWKLDDLMDFGEYLLENINGDEDFGLMSGDIIKAYGSSILRLEPVPEALIIMPEYEEYTLSQMRNANICGNLARDTTKVDVAFTNHPDETFKSGDIMQSNNGNLITCEGIPQGEIHFSDLSALIPGVITVTNPTPGVDDVLESTRLKTAYRDIRFTNLSQNSDILPIYCGSDVVVSYTVSMYADNGTDTYGLREYVVNTNAISTGTTITEDRNWGEHFKWTPTEYAVSAVDSGETTVGTNIPIYDLQQYWPLSDIDNYTVLDTNNVANLHEACLFSLLSVPGVAQIVG